MSAAPHSVINFVARVVIGMIWSMLLKVAEEIKVVNEKNMPRLFDLRLISMVGWNVGVT